MSTDDRDQPDRAANTAILNQIGQPPPASVLAAALTATGGLAPEHVAALPIWGEGETTWHLLGCSGGTVFAVRAHKGVDDWYGTTHHGAEEALSIGLWPLRDVTGLAFELKDVRSGDFAGISLSGTWTVSFGSGHTLEIPTDGRNEAQRTALAGIVEAVRGAL
jgi:hypothetical protein